ncbi:MAG: hypothetical protein ACFFC7_14205 [Candidatus Hermodarchaeota archaeon]
MNPLLAFPYKNMLKIVELVSQEEVTAAPIQRATGMCHFDSTEVSDMLSYLTTFGRVKKIEEGWIIEKTELKAKYGSFRKNYLKDAEDILKTLSDTPKSSEEIASEADKDIKMVELYLPFLEEITKYGLISRVQGKFKASWHLAS